MNFWRLTTKVFAFFYLLFAVSSSIQAQTTNNSSVYELPANTIIRVQMDNGISSRVSAVDDTFTAKIIEPVIVRETVVIPIGAIVEGKITKVRRASVGNRNGSLSVSFETLRFASGERREIKGVLFEELVIESSKTATALTIVGGTAVGALVGTVSKVDHGAAIGGGIGAGVGVGVAFLRKGRDVRIETDEKFEIKLVREVILPVKGF